MPYLNVAEAETRLELAELTHPTLCTRVQLPFQTHEKRTVHALRISSGKSASRQGVLLIGGTHAREWGSADIVVKFADDLLAAFAGGTGLTYGGKTYSANEVRAVLEKVDLFVIPCINPDGKQHSQTVYPMWRKNRSPTPDASETGTDLNRNYDFMFDIPRYFHPDMYDGTNANDELVVSQSPDSDVYQGASAFSEAESRNVRSLLEQHAHIRFFVDIHCYQESFYYPWGSDENQSADALMHFRNTAFDGQRGKEGDAYGEYMRPSDAARMQAIGERMNGALNLVRGKSYRVAPTYQLYPTCGMSHCYAFSRHIVDSCAGKVDGFLIEWGDSSFQPDYDSEMVPLMDDVCAALVELCLVADRVPRVVAVPCAIDFGRVRIGTSKERTVRIENRGSSAVQVTAVSVEAGPFAGSYFPGSAPSANIAAGSSAAVQVTFSPASSFRADANLLVEVQRPGETLLDVMQVSLTGTGCSLRSGACAAPVFRRTTNWITCLLKSAVLGAIILALVLFIWIPSVRCKIKQLLFEIQHCRDGNEDPCREL
jgi:murein tripeptide amidase MpaA